MKRLVAVLVMVAVQGIGLAQQKGVSSINPREVMEQMKSQDTFGIFSRGREKASSESESLVRPYERRNSQRISRREIQEPEPITKTHSATTQGVPSGFRVLAPIRSVREEPLSPLVEKKEDVPVGELEGFGFRELTGYEKLRTIQESGLMDAQTTPVEEVHKSYSFAPQRHPLQLDAFPLSKNQALSYGNEPIRTIKFKDTSEMPKGGIIVNTSEGQVFLRYNVVNALSRDGTKRALVIKKWDEVEIRVAEVVEIPASSR